MTPNTINVIVKAVLRAAGVSDKTFGAHSLRAGYVTTAHKNGVEFIAIAEQTGHKRVETVKLYTRYTPDVFKATKIADVFKGAFKKTEK
jgi:integrase